LLLAHLLSGTLPRPVSMGTVQIMYNHATSPLCMAKRKYLAFTQLSGFYFQLHIAFIMQ